MKEFTKAYVGLSVSLFALYLFLLTIAPFIENKVEYWWSMLTTGFVGFFAFKTAIFIANYVEEIEIEKRSKKEQERHQRILASAAKLRKGMSENVPKSNSIFTEPFNFLKGI